MRALMTTDTVGGVWTFTQELARGLLARGCAVYLVSLGGAPSQSQQRWLDVMQQDWNDDFSYEAWDTPLEWMEENDRAYYLPAGRLIRSLCQWGADLLHSNQFCFGALPVRIPKLVTAHSDVLSWADACRGGVLEHSQWLRRYKSLVVSGLSSADVIVCPTAWMAQVLARHFELQREIAVIPNGRSLPACSGERRLQAVTAGRIWDEAKNIGMLRDVRSPIPIFLAGEKHHGSATASDVLPDEMLLGPLSQEDLFALFRQSAIYICTSRYEPFGLAPLEAALCGCAVVANDMASLREVWGDGAVYFRDRKALEVVLNELWLNPQRLADAQRRSFSRALEFSAEQMTESYLALYQRLLAEAERKAYVA